LTGASGPHSGLANVLLSVPAEDVGVENIFTDFCIAASWLIDSEMALRPSLWVVAYFCITRSGILGLGKFI